MWLETLTSADVLTSVKYIGVVCFYNIITSSVFLLFALILILQVSRTVRQCVFCEKKKYNMISVKKSDSNKWVQLNIYGTHTIL